MRVFIYLQFLIIISQSSSSPVWTQKTSGSVDIPTTVYNGNGSYIIGDWLLSQIMRVFHCRAPCRTTLSFHKPTEDDLKRLFDVGGDSGMYHTAEFNHPFVGSMTNPSILRGSPISVAESKTSQPTPVETIPCCAATPSSTIADEDSFWIPDSFVEPSPSWRTYRIRKTVGYGKECYETLRDIILQWEGTQKPHTSLTKSNNKNHMNKNNAIRLMNYLPPMPTPTTPSQLSPPFRDFDQYSTASPATATIITSGDFKEKTPKEIVSLYGTNASVPSCYQIGGAFKKIITISKSPKLGIWVWNPCQVLYDLIDQRYNYQCYGTSSRSSHGFQLSQRPGGLTYTSTAYGTLKGHLLVGEERISVAIHDEAVPKNSLNHGNKSGKVEVEILSYSHATNSILGRLIFPFIKDMQEQFFRDQILTLDQIGKDVMMRQQRQMQQQLVNPPDQEEKGTWKPFSKYKRNNLQVDFCAH